MGYYSFIGIFLPIWNISSKIPVLISNTIVFLNFCKDDYMTKVTRELTCKHVIDELPDDIIITHRPYMIIDQRNT